METTRGPGLLPPPGGSKVHLLFPAGGLLEDQKRTSGELEFTTPLSNNEAHLPNPHPKVSVEAMWGA